MHIDAPMGDTHHSLKLGDDSDGAQTVYLQTLTPYLVKVVSPNRKARGHYIGAIHARAVTRPNSLSM